MDQELQKKVKFIPGQFSVDLCNNFELKQDQWKITFNDELSNQYSNNIK